MPKTRLITTITKPDGTSETHTYEYDVRIKKVIETLNKKTSTPGRAICDLKHFGKTKWTEYYTGDTIEISVQEVQPE